jgi:hypothetical protein
MIEMSDQQKTSYYYFGRGTEPHGRLNFSHAALIKTLKMVTQ